MEIKGKLRIYVSKKKGVNGPFNTYYTNISSNAKDGTHLCKSIDVKFAQQHFAESTLNKQMDDNHCYVYNITNSFMSLKNYRNADGEMIIDFQLIIRDAELLEIVEVVRQDNKPDLTTPDEDLPF